MGSLTTCIKKAGAALRPEDKQAILDRAEELKSQGISTAKAAEQAVSEQIEAVKALIGVESAPKAAPDDDYIQKLFGTPQEQAAAQDRMMAAQSAKAASLQRIRDAIAAEKKRAVAEYDDWSGRVYKKNKTQVDLHGDGPSNQSSMSIGSINESRRRNAMDALSKEMTEISKLEQAVSTDTGVERVLSNLQAFKEKAKTAVESGNWPGSTVDSMFESMLLDSLQFRGPGGKGNVTSNGLSKALLSAIKENESGKAQEAQTAQEDRNPTAGADRVGGGSVAPVATHKDPGQLAEPAPKVYKTRKAAESAKTGNTQRLKKISGGYILRNATDKEMAAADKAGRRLASGGGVDVERDSLLMAIAKLGGLRMSERADTIGEGNRNIGGKMLFTSGGKSIDDIGNGALAEYGYIPADQRNDPTGWLRSAVKDEFMGTRQFFSDQGTEWMQEDQAATEALTDDELAELSEYDLQSSGYLSATPEVQALTEQLIAEAEALGIDTEAAQEDAARNTEGQSANDYHAAVQEIIRQAVAEARENAQGRDTSATSAGGQDRGESASEESPQDLTLTAPTKAQVLAQQDALEKERADREAASDQPKSRLIGDQVDIFNTQGSVFDAPAPARDMLPTSTSSEAATGAKRTRPRGTVVFKRPIVGVDGNRLLSYSWQWKPFEYVDNRGEERVARVSDWDNSETSAETGREVVHQFTVDVDGKEQTVSAEGALRLLGFLSGERAANFKSLSSAAKTLARLRMQQAELESVRDAFENDKAAVDSKPLPPMPTEPTAVKTASGRTMWEWQLGDADGVVGGWDADKPARLTDERKNVLIRQWRENRMKEIGGWKNASFRGDDFRRQLEDLSRRISKQQSKIDALVAQEPAPADEDMRGYAWALVKNGRVVRSGSLPSPEFSPASADTKMSYYKDMADKDGAELYVGGYPGAAAWAPQDGLIFGMTWAELTARQQRGGQGQRIPEGKMPKDAVLAYSPSTAPVAESQAQAEPAKANAADAQEQEQTVAPMPAIGSISMSLAQQAHSGTSFVPERRAEQERDSFNGMLQDAWQRAARVAGNDAAAVARITEVFQDVADGYRARYTATLQARSRVMSTMIAGGSNFPVARNRKRMETERKRADEASEYLTRGIKRLLRAARGPIDNSPESELERVRLNLSQREETQEQMKSANVALRKGDDATLEDLGFSAAEIAELKKPDFAGRTGFPDYKLTNNNAEIRRLKERLKSAEERMQDAASGPVETERAGVKIVEDATDDRLRLIFDGKPSEAVREDLKANGFKWSPKNEAWQRQLTGNARHAAKVVLDKHYPTDDAGNVAMFSQGRGMGISMRDAKAIKTNISAILPNAPEIILHESVEQAPEALQDEIRAQDAWNDVEAVYWNGEIHVFPAHMASVERAEFVIGRHEIRHHGMRTRYGNKLDAVLLDMHRKNASLREAAQGIKDTGRAGPKETVKAIEEALADMPVDMVERLTGFDRFVAAVRDWLRMMARRMRANGLPNVAAAIEPKDWTDRDVAAFVLKAERVSGAGSSGVAFSRAPATDTDAFRKWFKDSQVVDSKGNPLVVYHGTFNDFSAFDKDKLGENTDKTASSKSYAETARVGFWFNTQPMSNSSAGYAVDMPVYLSIQNPYREMNLDWLAQGLEMDSASEYRDNLIAQGYDGIVLPDEEFGGTSYIAFNPEQIKSAIGNNGDFDGSNPDIRFSRSVTIDGMRSAMTARNVANVWDDMTRSSAKFNWWHKSVGTQYHKARTNPLFGKVYDKAQEYLHDTAAFANDPADMAPDLLPQLKTLSDMKKSLALKKDDAEKLSSAVFAGTLDWKRDDSGQLVESGIGDDPGVVFTPGELRSMFGFNDKQIALYQQFRKATDRSLDILVAADVARMLGDGLPESMKAMISSGDTGRFKGLLTAYLKQSKDKATADLAEVRKRHRNEMAAHWREQKKLLAGPRGRAGSRLALEAELEKAKNALKFKHGGELFRVEQEAKKWAELEKTVGDKYTRIDDLKANGYAPLMRFGRYTVDVLGEDGSRQFFGMFETEREANAAARKFRESAADGEVVNQGILSEEAFKQFSGLTPETIELFAEVAGVEKSAIFEEYLRRAKNNRSALKRLIKRTGVAGFSDDTPRVLASFITSNARAASASIHLGDLAQAVEDIPKEMGDVKDEAIRLREYVQNPQEEAAGIRGLLFVQYLGGSVASALVNMTQPLMMTLPYLSQFGGPAKAAARLSAAVKLAAGKADETTALGKAIRQAEKEGILEPQELHQLQAESSRTLGNNPHLRKMLFAWGGFFSLAERFNRRVSFIAAWNTAQEQGIANPLAFASRSVDETQGVYNKANRPDWARGSIGAMVFTFKQYSISYMEFLTRLPKREQGLALAILLLAAGAQGLPGADDLDDLIDTFGQHMGYATNAKQWKTEVLADAIGAEAADFVLRGFSAIPGVPLDVAGRLGLGNLGPGTGMLRKDKADKSSEVVEALGPAASTITNTVKALPALFQGDLGKVNELAGPVALKNLQKAIGMYLTGEYRDGAGRKVMDVGALDAAVKAIGFQPAEVARSSRKASTVMQQVALVRTIETEIASQWAQGVAEGDQDMVQAARERLAKWNTDNPTRRIVVNSAQIRRRVMEMKSTREERLIKRTPKEMRATMAAALA